MNTRLRPTRMCRYAASGVLAWLLVVGASAAGQAPGHTAPTAFGPGVAALQHLQNGEVAQALETLAEAVDQPAAWPTADNALSAAAGGLYRALVDLDADERYDLLYAWSMPADARPHVRMLTRVVPQTAPPSVFARVLGERPRDNSFAVAEIGGIRGLLNTGWLLVLAAEDAGRLRRLTAELEPLAAGGDRHAQTLLLLAKLADARAEVTELATLLEARAARLRSAGAPPEALVAGIDPADVVLAAAALRHERLRPISEAMLHALVERTLDGTATELRPFLRMAHATAVQQRWGASGTEVLYNHRLKHWTAVSGKTAELNSRGALDAVWLLHEDHILHLAGAGNDVLFLRYPLTGDFEFTCETQEGGRIGTEGGLVYGGLQFEALGSTNQLTVWDADLAHPARKPCPFVWHEDRPIFNRVGIRSHAQGATFVSNLHPVWFDGPPCRQSPWIGLRSFGDRRPLFRNLKITGQPVIPREVRLSEGDSLRGWRSQFYGEQQLAHLQSDSETAVADPDWRMAGGVIHAARRKAAAAGSKQSWLHYQRPLLDGETIAYEFLHASGEAVVHPALGRLAFLLEPAGVRVHWMTDNEHEWTGLPPDNALLEPLNRRGPRPLPLKNQGWNRVMLARSQGKVTLSLNDTLVYERSLDFAGDHTFGFYRDRTQTAAQIRNVVMTGDWPQSLPADLLETTSTSNAGGAAPARAERTTVGAIVGEMFLAENVRSVRRRAATMKTADRYEFLRRWILPNQAGGASGEFRFAGEFTQTQPAPILDSEAAGPRADQGAELVSPVYDLLDAARELGKLAELRQQVAGRPDLADEHQQRAKLALLILLAWELDDPEAATKAMDRFYPLVVKATPTDLAEVWPETLVIHRAQSQTEGNALIGDLLGSIYQRRTMQNSPAGVDFWHTHIVAWMARHQHIVTGGAAEAFDAPDELRDWVSVVRMRAKSRGKGCALARWRRNELGEVHHRSGHQEEYLFYRSPLRGDFDLTCEIGAYGTTQVLAAGSFCGPVSDLSLLEYGSFRRGAIERKPIHPPLEKPDPWVHYRAASRDGVCTVYLNGRAVHSETLSEHSDPWVGIRSWWRNGGRVRDVRIAGAPEIPEEVVLSASPALDGWLPYHEESIGYDGARWQYVADPESSGWIIGRRGEHLAGCFSESLLTYQRPLVEDGSIEYEFFYEPGRFETHPAMDRLALLLRPEGVRLHWITDAPFDRTDLSPGNVLDEPHNRRGPAAAPLKPLDWNQLRLSMTGLTLSLTLNGQLIFERELEASNQRTFGIFHDAGATEARVRNVVMRGDWPRTLPTPSGQELADPVVAALDARLPQLTAVFAHDFAQEGLNPAFFQYKDSRGGAQLSPRPDGLRIVRPASGAWTNAEISARFIARGDFDLAVEYGQFACSGDKDACILLVARLADAPQHHCRTLRNRIATQRQMVQSSLSAIDRDGKRNYVTKQLPCEATSGRLRVARRGNEVFYLHAEGDSPNFRLVGKDVVSTADTLPGGIDLSAIANGAATVSAVWKNVRIAAEELLILPDPAAKPKNVLFVMNADGSELRQITKEMPEYTSHGSPDWSPDGKQIAFDAWSGNAGSSRMFVVNADGTGLRDLGPGLMPTFSPDGRSLAFTQSSGGAAIMDMDGANRQVITDEGWGAQWSPNGKWIAYESRHDVGGQSVSNITIIDLKTKQRRTLLEGDRANRYSQIYWNMEWSPDSRRICFKGNLRVPVTGAASETAITEVAGSSQGFEVLTMAQIQTDFSWRPDGRSILMSQNSPEHGGNRLFLCDLQTRQIRLLPSQPLDQHNVSGVWSPDGRRIVFSSQRTLKPVAWRSKESS